MLQSECVINACWLRHQQRHGPNAKESVASAQLSTMFTHSTAGTPLQMRCTSTGHLRVCTRRCLCS